MPVEETTTIGIAGLDRLLRLETIVKHALSEQDDQLCWMDLYNAEMAALVGVPWPPRCLSREAMLHNCRRFVECLETNQPYIAPIVTEEEAAALRAEIDRLKTELAARPESSREQMEWQAQGFTRDDWGWIVRAAWVKWARTQPQPKASWLVDYADLSEPMKEVDCQIAEAVLEWAKKPWMEEASLRAEIAALKAWNEKLGSVARKALLGIETYREIVQRRSGCWSWINLDLVEQLQAALAGSGEIKPAPARPHIVCLCGSTRFKAEFIEANFRESLAGRIVLSVGFFSHAEAAVYTLTEAEKTLVDEVYLHKVSMADEIYVINVGGYVGSSTKREVRYAISLGKPIRWLEPERAWDPENDDRDNLVT